MKRTVYIPPILALIVLAAACQSSNKPPARAEAPEGGKLKKAELAFEIPYGDDFPMEGAQAADYLVDYKFKVSASKSSCAVGKKKGSTLELHDYVGNEWIKVPVDDACSYRVRFAIGRQRDDGSFEAYYHTDKPVTVLGEQLQEDGGARFQLRLKRSTAGEKVGFEETWVKVGQGGGKWEPKDKNPPPSGGDKVVYADVEPIIEDKCATCHASGAIPPQLTSFADVEKVKNRVLARSEARTMPPKDEPEEKHLTDDELALLLQWAEDGYLEKADDDSGRGQDDDRNQDDDQDQDTEDAVTYAQIEKIIVDNCAAACHEAGGSFPGIPLTNYAEVSKESVRDRVVIRSTAKSMPPAYDQQGRTLTDEEIALIKKWADDGYKEGGDEQANNDPNNARFVIPDQLTSGGWNLASNPVEVKVGGELTVVNNTDKRWWIHTNNGAPFPHPGGYIEPGASETYVIRSRFDGAVRQHDNTPNNFQFYIRATD